MKIVIFDPPLCCSTGLCGPDIDPVLVKMNDTFLTLKSQGVEVERFNLSQQPGAFAGNNTVAGLLKEEGSKVLPVTLVNGEVYKTGGYPSYEELCEKLGLEILQVKRSLTLTAK